MFIHTFFLHMGGVERVKHVCEVALSYVLV